MKSAFFRFSTALQNHTTFHCFRRPFHAFCFPLFQIWREAAQFLTESTRLVGTVWKLLFRNAWQRCGIIQILDFSDDPLTYSVFRFLRSAERLLNSLNGHLRGTHAIMFAIESCRDLCASTLCARMTWAQHLLTKLINRDDHPLLVQLHSFEVAVEKNAM